MLNVKNKTILFIVALLSISHLQVSGKVAVDTLLQKTFNYPETISPLIDNGQDTLTYSYIKYTLDVKKRNVFLMAVPTMYVIAHGGRRRYIGETYHEIHRGRNGKYTSKRLLSTTTIPKNHITFPTIINYLTPNFYETSMIDGNILSPFNRSNRKYYHYEVEPADNGMVKIRFKPKLKNTILVNGSAIVSPLTGQISYIHLTGKFDMIDFSLAIRMGNYGEMTLIPKECILSAKFNFLGNDIRAYYSMTYNLPKVLRDSITDSHDIKLIVKVRPQQLTGYERMIYEEGWPKKTDEKKDSVAVDSTQIIKRRRLKVLLWDNLGAKLLSETHTRFGQYHQASVSIRPILNPLYMGYNHSMGFYYKFDVRGKYYFSPNSDLWMRFKSGYSFKLRQFFFEIPLNYVFNRRKNGYIHSELANGKWIKSGRIINEVNEMYGNHLGDSLQLEKFKNMYWDTFVNYDINEYFGLQGGFILRKRTAVNKEGFHIIHKPTSYKTFAPKIAMFIRPSGYKGPVLMASYERSFRHFPDDNIPYQRWEFDGQYILPLRGLRNISMRIGTGFYADKDENGYFIDYENFRSTTIPDGWNDKWSGEFEYLNGDLYNTSTYYVRANFTYESPIIIFSYLPFLGQFVQKERFYFSGLSAVSAHPYIELGYAFKTHVLSVGTFFSFLNGKYQRFGFKFGFELFRQW